MLANMKPKERSMRTPSHPTTLPHSAPAPRRPKLLLTAILLGGMSILAACQMTAHELAAMQYRMPVASDSERQAKWDSMSPSQQKATVDFYETRTGNRLPKAADNADDDRRGGGDGGGH